MFSSVSNMSGALTQHNTSPPPRFKIKGGTQTSVPGYKVYTFTKTTTSATITYGKYTTGPTGIYIMACGGGGGIYV